ncbi:SusD family protein [Pseudarcicella hirudinis]|uniref:SusD family protein n=1 Tax=Pseudarcicella hirudinis TaxID=1079859 RepID=A0A1I5Z157_9BACT|nr:RagB/SusD family nutrient uptake outer membrane protein [Pseudarcicella hirudinis]SFQ50216.1 SusD family protein [Pseudarcicella hirudinis]
MKKRLIYISLLASSLLMGCGNKLDIKPVNDIDASTALTTSGDIEALLVGAYDSMGDGDVLGGNIQRDAELIADNGELSFVGTFTAPREIFRKKLLRDDQQAEDTWFDTYRTINIANNVLANTGVVTAAKKSKVEGEAKFIRGLMYFELIRVYAKTFLDGNPLSNPGVPLVLVPTKQVDGSSFVGRNSVQEVYAQIIKDLTDAEKLLPVSNGFFATKNAAAAILSRVYLMSGDYANARDAADRVIASKVYSLVPGFQDEFNTASNTSEDIFAMQVTAQDGVNSLVTFFASSDKGGRGDIIIEDKHLALYDANDTRNFFYVDGDRFTGKWADPFANVKIARLSEMYLTRAEANFRLGTKVGASPVDDINVVRLRAGVLPASSVTLQSILKERRLELAFEGHWIHDIKRTKTTIIKGTDSYPFNAPNLIFPIPLREINTNNKLVQNEGY